MAKLYNHVSRFLVRSKINRRTEKLLQWALTLKTDDIINDCSGFNVNITNINLEVMPTKHGWYIYDVTFDVYPYGGSCSLTHCGVEPALSREQVEKRWLHNTECYINSGSIASWYGKKGNALNEKLIFLNKRMDILKSGGHITDELGVLLPEFR